MKKTDAIFTKDATRRKENQTNEGEGRTKTKNYVSGKNSARKKYGK